MRREGDAATGTQEFGLFGPRRSDAIRAGFLFNLAGTGLLLLITFLEAIGQEFSVHANPISDMLAVGASTATIGEPAAFLLAVAWIVGAYFVFRTSTNKRFGVVNLLPGIGLLLAVLSPENVNVAVHTVGTLLGVIPGAIVMIWTYRLVRSPFRYVSLALGVLSLIGIVVLFGGYSSPLVQDTLGPGGWERIIVYPLLAWLIGFGSALLSSISFRDGHATLATSDPPTNRPGPRAREDWEDGTAAGGN